MVPEHEIRKILADYSLNDDLMTVDNFPLLSQIESRLESQEELIFILPAFPAKSPSLDKTCGLLPDMGEVLALQNLQLFCDRLSEIHKPGAKILICSDGRVFSDLVNVSDENIDRYNAGIKAIIREYSLPSLSVYSMEDFYPQHNPDELREILIKHFAMNKDVLRNLILTVDSYAELFNGIHRFLLEDSLGVYTNLSKSAVRELSKKNAYELLRRSDAWSKLLDKQFPTAMRLSIHPYPITHEKFGIKLVKSSTRWATPWHNVTVKLKNEFELMHYKQAKLLNAQLRLEREKYAYFEVSTI